MKSILTVIFMTLFAFATTTFAGVAAYNNTTNLGVSNNVKCAEGMNCAISGKYLVLKTRNSAIASFTSGDVTPSILAGNFFRTPAVSGTGPTYTTFDDGIAGKEITVIAAAAASYDVTGTALHCGSTDISVASGDVTKWVYDSDKWRCTSHIEATDNMN